MQGWGLRKNRRVGVALAVAACIALPALASAHIERASYWPDPAADRSVSPVAGGRVPTARTLSSALHDARPGKTRVVCKGNSLTILRQSIGRARRKGYDVRPHDHEALSKKRAARLIELNTALKKRCKYREIQAAVTPSRNNDRVVVMPGVYTEPTSRSKPTDDPRCEGLEEQNDRGQTGAVSYRYQWRCPNDQNLIAVLGRRPNGTPPQPPLEERRGIPDNGPCYRCNFQIEGSGVNADDVIVEGGDASKGNGGPGGGAKDIGIRADRADGFVLRNITVRHVNEHGIYVPETDGYLLDRFKTFYAAEYGVLTFAADHALIQNCETVGSDDAGLYPGATPETGTQTEEGAPRFNTRIRFCDSHHNAIGYSGTNGNAVHVDHNNFYDNTTGFVTDVITAAGHPGYPQDSDLIEHNNFYSNNLDTYSENAEFHAAAPVPIGTGILIAGGNNNVVRHNRVWDNWRFGIALISVPDTLICGPGTDNEQAGCDPSKNSTSFDNEFYDNTMSVDRSGNRDLNALDFIWDHFPGNTGNCWYDNKGPDGTDASVTKSPEVPPLPSDCETSIGTGSTNEILVARCIVSIALDGAQDHVNGRDPTLCPSYEMPPEPESQEGVAAQSEQRTWLEDLENDPAEIRRLCDFYGRHAGEATLCK